MKTTTPNSHLPRVMPDRPVTYLLAIPLALLGLGLQALFIRFAGFPFVGFLYPGVIIAAYYLGFGPSLLTVGVSALASSWMVGDHPLAPFSASGTGLLRLVIFLATSVFSAWVVAYAQRTRIALARSEARHAESESLFQKLADDLPALVWRLDRHHQCTWLSRGWLEYTGRTMQQDLGMGWTENIHPDDYDGAVRAFTEQTQKLEPFRLEYRLRRKDGVYRWFYDIGAPSYSPNGVFQGYVGQCVDVHEQREAQFTVKAMQERFDRSVSAVSLGIWYCDLPFDELIWSPVVKEHFWLPPEARVTIQTFYERIHPEDREPTRKAIDRSIEERAPYDIIYRTTHPDDPTRIKYIRAIGWTHFDETGRPIRFDGVTLDNTSYHRATSERDETLLVLETINSVGKSLSAELDIERLVQSVTDAATKISRAEFGAFFYNVTNEKGESYTLYSISGVPREAFSKFPMPRNTPIFAPTFGGEGIVRSADITKDPRYGHNPPHHGMPKGHLPVVSYLAVPVISRSGEVIGGLFFGHSKPGIFTEREERIVAGLAAQTAIAMDNARLFEKAHQAIQLRDEFLSISSHELKTPLTPLKLQLQSLLRTLDRGGTGQVLSEEQLRRLVQTSERQVDRLTVLVDDLLDVSRISTGKLSLNREPVDLAEVVRDVVDRYRPQLQQAGCALETHFIERLPAEVDRLRFEQVLVNLLTNAMRYAAGKPIRVSLHEESGLAILRIADEGVGIAPADQKRIFERFERVQSSARVGGLGLGLYIAHQIINAHQGTIEVESQLGRGSVFTVRMPPRPLPESGH